MLRKLFKTDLDVFDLWSGSGEVCARSKEKLEIKRNNPLTLVLFWTLGFWLLSLVLLNSPVWPLVSQEVLWREDRAVLRLAGRLHAAADPCLHRGNHSIWIRRGNNEHKHTQVPQIPHFPKSLCKMCLMECERLQNLSEYSHVLTHFRLDLPKMKVFDSVTVLI